jgi:hypothetical protein
VLGDFDLTPGNDIVGNAGVRDGAIMPTGGAVLVWVTRLDHPIADIEGRVGTKSISLLLDGKRVPDLALGLKRRKRHDVWDEAETMAAFPANGVLEIEQLLAVLAFEELHCRFRLFVLKYAILKDNDAAHSNTPQRANRSPASGA